MMKSSVLEFTLCDFGRYEEAREEEKLRNKPEDFSDMVAEVIKWLFDIYILL